MINIVIELKNINLSGRQILSVFTIILNYFTDKIKVILKK